MLRLAWRWHGKYAHVNSCPPQTAMIGWPNVAVGRMRRGRKNPLAQRRKHAVSDMHACASWLQIDHEQHRRDNRLGQRRRYAVSMSACAQQRHHVTRAFLGPVWLDQNWNRFQNPLRLFRPDFLKPNPDSWNHETSPGAGFIGFKMADGDGKVSMETSDNLFKQFTVFNFTIKS